MPLHEQIRKLGLRLGGDKKGEAIKTPVWICPKCMVKQQTRIRLCETLSVSE
jgi:hypothetical protein